MQGAKAITLNVSKYSCSRVLSSLKRPAGITQKLAATFKAGRNRIPLVVRANELNKWANRDGGEEHTGADDDGFDRDTAYVVLRVLTARATQRVLMHLEELDLFVCQWLNNFAADNPPSEGNKFILKLYSELGKVVVDPSSGVSYRIDPQNLAHQILQVREEMARGIASGFGSYVSTENMLVMRTHLEKHSYTSGNLEKGKGGTQSRRRGYARPKYGKSSAGH